MAIFHPWKTRSGSCSMKEIENFFKNIGNALPTITLVDILDILLVAFLIYYAINLIRTTSAYRIAKAIVLLIVLTLLTDLFKLHTMNFLLNRVLELGVVALVIVFQPELRKLLERLGGRSLKEIVNKTVTTDDTFITIRETVAACESMSNERVGALIVFERINSLEHIYATGTRVDAQLSQELIRNIFFPKAALHDGAMIVANNRIQAAGCVLPLSENRSLSTDLGTRHRAGVGMSESSDALVIIVSEETGAVSVAIDGMLKRDLAEDTLRRLLEKELVRDDSKKNVIERIKKIRRKENGDDTEA